MRRAPRLDMRQYRLPSSGFVLRLQRAADVRLDLHALRLVVEFEASAADYSTRLLDRHRLVGLRALFLGEDMQQVGRERYRAGWRFARLRRLCFRTALDTHMARKVAAVAVSCDRAAIGADRHRWMSWLRQRQLRVREFRAVVVGEMIGAHG